MSKLSIFKVLSVKYKYPELFKLLFKFSYFKKYNVLFVGDSVAERISNLDKDKRTLAGMLNNNFSGKDKMLSISHSAYNLRMYDSLLQCFKILKYRPKAVIVPINIRSFSPQWCMEPDWKFEKELDIINSFLSDNIQGFDYKFEFLDTNVKFALTTFTQRKQFKDVIDIKGKDEASDLFRKKLIFIYHYTYQLNQQHELLKYFTNIINLARTLNIKLFFYVTPINYQAGLDLVGESFLKIVRSNLNIIRDIFLSEAHSGVHFENYLELLPKDNFFNEDSPTEHLNQIGRKILANTIYTDFKKFTTNSNNKLKVNNHELN